MIPNAALKRKDYKSPTSKLITFFKGSRDNWKEKYIDAKYNEKKLKNRVSYLKRTKKELKQKIRELQEEIMQMQAGMRKIEEEEVVKKSP